MLIAIGAVASAVISVNSAMYTTQQLSEIRSRVGSIDDHLSSLTTYVSEQHNTLVNGTKEIGSLYEYNHLNFRKISKELTEMDVKLKLFNMQCTK